MLDGIGKDPPNPTYTCVVKMTPRGQYITWKNALRKKSELLNKEYLEENLMK